MSARLLACSQNFCHCSHARICVKMCSIPVWQNWETLEKRAHECSLARARQIFATARSMLGFSLKCAQYPYGKTEKHWRNIEACTHYECFCKHASSFWWRIIQTDARNNSSRKAPPKVESNLETWKHVEYYYYHSSSELVRAPNRLDPWSLQIKLPLRWIFFSNSAGNQFADHRNRNSKCLLD